MKRIINEVKKGDRKMEERNRKTDLNKEKKTGKTNVKYNKKYKRNDQNER